MGRKLKGIHAGKKGLKGALARQVIKQDFRKKAAGTADNRKTFESQKELSVKAGTSNTKKQRANAQAAKQQGICPFTFQDRVLLIGEGDFSFAMSLVQNGKVDPSKLIATSFDTRDQVIEKYPDAQQVLDVLESDGVNVMHGIDARNLAASMKLVSPTKATKIINKKLFSDHAPLDYIVFNFPHAGEGIKDVDRNIIHHQKLMLAFFKSCVRVFEIVNQKAQDAFAGYASHENAQRARGKVILTLFEGEPYVSWGIKTLARSENLQVERLGRFDWTMFPEYHHRRTAGLGNTNKPAEERDARIYVFEKSQRRVEDSKRDDSDSD